MSALSSEPPDLFDPDRAFVSSGALHGPDRPRRAGPDADLLDELPATLWRADRLGREPLPAVPSGHAELDAQLPGGGWPVQALTEVLQARPGGAEWRLLGPALRRLGVGGAPVLLIGPPHRPHWPGLGGPAALPRLLWVRAERAAERLWAAEQALRSGDFGAALVWLPQARSDELRRLQSWARQGRAPVFVFRPLAAQAESSPAPLRLALSPGPLDAPWRLQVRLLKRRGPVLDAPVEFAALPPALAGIVPRLPSHPPRRQAPPPGAIPAGGLIEPEFAIAALVQQAHALVRADSARLPAA